MEDSKADCEGNKNEFYPYSFPASVPMKNHCEKSSFGGWFLLGLQQRVGC